MPHNQVVDDRFASFDDEDMPVDIEINQHGPLEIDTTTIPHLLQRVERLSPETIEDEFSNLVVKQKTRFNLTLDGLNFINHILEEASNLEKADRQEFLRPKSGTKSTF